VPLCPSPSSGTRQSGIGYAPVSAGAVVRMPAQRAGARLPAAVRNERLQPAALAAQTSIRCPRNRSRYSLDRERGDGGGSGILFEAGDGSILVPGEAGPVAV